MQSRTCWIVLLCAALSADAACTGEDSASKSTAADVDMKQLAPVVDNAYVAFASLKRAVYAGKERDPESGKMVEIRVEVVPRPAPEKVAGIPVTVVEVTDFEAGEMVEKTLDYYAQDAAGNAYYVGEKVDDFEDGKVVGHGGQWLAGVNGAKPGLFMPAKPKVGDVFEQERAPGIAEDRSTVVAVGVSVTVPAGTFSNCIQTEDFDPVGKTTQNKFFAPGVGLVKEILSDGKSTIELVKRETR